MTKETLFEEIKKRHINIDETKLNQLFDLINHCGIVNMKELMAFLDWRGEEYGLTNQGDVVDVVASNGNLFRMMFDANYQNGFRPQYARRVDAETGESISGVRELTSKTKEGE